MLKAVTYATDAGMRDQSEVETLIRSLISKGYLPVIRGMLSGVFDLAKLPAPSTSITTEILERRPLAFSTGPMRFIGDVFLAEDSACILLPRGMEKLQTSIISYKNPDDLAKKFCSDIEDGIRYRFDGRRVRGMTFEWKATKPALSKRFGRYYRTSSSPYDDPEAPSIEAEFNSREPEYTPSDAEAACVLRNSDMRRLILKLAQVTKIREKEVGDLVAKHILDEMIALGLIREEYLLTCKQDQHTICVVANKSDLSKEPMRDARCSVCGRSFSNELLQVIYTLTDLGKKLATGSLWMSIWITELLIKSGVRKESIKWGLEANGEELDIFIEDFDSRVFLELKDREFGLGDSYPFIYRLVRYGGAIGIVATMDKVAEDSQVFFKEEAKRREYPVEIRKFEGTAGIEAGIEEVIKDMSTRQVRRLLTPFSERVGINLWPIVAQWLQKTQELESESSG